LAQSTWERRGIPWSALSWGLLLGCGLIGFRSTEKKLRRRPTRLYRILVTEA
ncbi:hypothetical protein POSPLADRAFT_1077219, partial [Postia placenta MAD-698-R-SB12]